MSKRTTQRDDERLSPKQEAILNKLANAMPLFTEFQLGQLDMLAQMVGGRRGTCQR